MVFTRFYTTHLLRVGDKQNFTLGRHNRKRSAGVDTSHPRGARHDANMTQMCTSFSQYDMVDPLAHQIRVIKQPGLHLVDVYSH